MNTMRELGRNRQGNVAMMTAVTLGVLLMGVGAAFDYSAAAQRNNDLQNFADAAVLAAAASREDKRKKLQKIAEAVVAQHNTNQWPLTVEVKVIDDDIVVDVFTDYNTMIMGIAGKDKMPVRVSSTSPFIQPTPVNLALVLDTTESMRGKGIDGLKKAADKLLDELDDFEAPTAVSVVPFARYVNVGTHRKGAAWLNVDDDGTSKTEERCWDETRIVKEGSCTPTGRTITYDDIRDGRNFGKKTREEQDCTPTEREKTGVRLCDMITHTKTWHGCMGSRQAPHNTAAAFGGHRLPGVMNASCGTEVQTLTTDIDAVEDMIDGLDVEGNTYMPSGLVWGWRTLQDDAPFRKPAAIKAAEGPEVIRAMIFMTDGENTLSQQGGDDNHKHEGKDQTKADAQTLALCDAIRAEDIQIYTIGYRMGPDRKNERKLLKDCAGNAARYFDAKDAKKLERAFLDIAESLDVTRLGYRSKTST